MTGFNAQKSHQIVDMHECHILRPELFALVAPLRGGADTVENGRLLCAQHASAYDAGVFGAEALRAADAPAVPAPAALPAGIPAAL